MPYFSKKEFEYVVDVYGNKINVGDILAPVGDNDFPDNYICYEDFQAEEDSDHRIVIRDLCNNNVMMCEVGLDGDVKTIGNYKDHLDLIDKEDIEFYNLNNE